MKYRYSFNECAKSRLLILHIKTNLLFSDYYYYYYGSHNVRRYSTFILSHIQYNTFVNYYYVWTIVQRLLLLLLLCVRSLLFTRTEFPCMSDSRDINFCDIRTKVLQAVKKNRRINKTSQSLSQLLWENVSKLESNKIE